MHANVKNDIRYAIFRLTLTLWKPDIISKGKGRERAVTDPPKWVNKINYTGT